MTVAFPSLPTSTLVPFAYAEFDPTNADQGSAILQYNVLLIGSMLSTGAAKPYTKMRPMSKKMADDYFGVGSMASQMVTSFFNNNNFTEMYCIGVPDADVGVKATGTITLSGSVTAAAPIELYIGGVRVRTAALYGSTAESIATAMNTAINAEADLSVTSTVSGAVVTLTAKHAGEVGNDIDIRLSYYGESQPEGLTITIGKMSGGAGNPDMTEVIEAMGDDWYQVIAMPYADEFNLAILRDELDDRWGPLRQIGGQAFMVKTGTFGEVTTFANERNDKGLTILPSQNSPTLSWAYCAATAGVIAYYGSSDPARGFNTLPLVGVLAPEESDRWRKFPEVNQSLSEGVSSSYVAADGTVRLQKIITTYRLNPLGADTRAYYSLNTPLTLMYMRYSWNNNLMLKFPRHKLAGDTDAKYLDATQPVMTPKVGKAEVIAFAAANWVPLGLMENLEQFKATVVCERNAFNENRLDWLIEPDVINQFEVAGTLIRHRV